MRRHCLLAADGSILLRFALRSRLKSERFRDPSEAGSTTRRNAGQSLCLRQLLVAFGNCKSEHRALLPRKSFGNAQPCHLVYFGQRRLRARKLDRPRRFRFATVRNNKVQFLPHIGQLLDLLLEGFLHIIVERQKKFLESNLK